METSAEACWRLSKACGQWAVESRDSAARLAFRQMSSENAQPQVERDWTTHTQETVLAAKPLF